MWLNGQELCIQPLRRLHHSFPHNSRGLVNLGLSIVQIPYGSTVFELKLYTTAVSYR